MAGTKTEEDAKMAKLYFKYGAMGSSKSAQALITKFNYEELGMTVWLIKPSVDTRDGADIIKSRIGLAKKADIILPEDNIIEKFDQHPGMDVIIADECQFFTPEQIDQLRTLVDERDMPVICFGLRTDFLTHLFPGSRRLFEVADSLTADKDHMRLRAQGNRQCPNCGRAHRHRGRAGLFGRQRKLCCHVLQVLAGEDQKAAGGRQ